MKLAGVVPVPTKILQLDVNEPPESSVPLAKWLPVPPVRLLKQILFSDVWVDGVFRAQAIEGFVPDAVPPTSTELKYELNVLPATPSSSMPETYWAFVNDGISVIWLLTTVTDEPLAAKDRIPTTKPVAPETLCIE